jgi:hypothetical protein
VSTQCSLVAFIASADFFLTIILYPVDLLPNCSNMRIVLLASRITAYDCGMHFRGLRLVAWLPVLKNDVGM